MTDSADARRQGWATPMGLRLLRRHPGVRQESQLTLGERSADRIRNGMGSWPFVLSAIVFLVIWMGFNRNTGFDPYPFILLNLVLSCLAAMQGAILLIAAKRSDQISAELAIHDYETNKEALADIKALRAMTEEIAKIRALLETSGFQADGQPGQT